MDKMKQLELLEQALDCMLELSELTCYGEAHFRPIIEELRMDINELL